MTEGMTEQTAEELLYNLFGALSFGDTPDDEMILSFEGATVRTFNEAGLLTGNKGLVLKLRDGSKILLTIVVDQR